METRPCMVSVLCTAYNHEQYIAQALESFVSQKTDFAFEVLVNDDASTDGTAAIIRTYAEKYPDIIRPVYQKENLYRQRINISQTILFPMARGRYIAICEGDDYWTDEEKLQRQVEFLERHPDYAACVHNTECLNCHSGNRHLLFVSGGDCDLCLEDVLFSRERGFHTSSLMLRKELYIRPAEFKYARVGDYPRAIWLAMNGPIRCLGRVMSVYRLFSGASAWSSHIMTREELIAYHGAAADMLRRVQSHARRPEQAALLEKAARRRELEVLTQQGRLGALLRQPYRALWREDGLKGGVKRLVKCLFPRAVERRRLQR